MDKDFVGKAGMFLAGLALILIPAMAPLTVFGQAHASDLMVVGISLVGAATGAHLQGSAGKI